MEKQRTIINLQTIVLIALLTVLLLTGCDSGSQIRQSVSRAVSVNCDAAEILSEYDSHGGFHGDGTSFYALQYSDHTARDEIARSDQWKPLPLTDNLSAAVYGDDSHAPLIIKDNDWKGKYDKEHADFETYKKDVASRETTAKIRSEYKKLLADCKVGEKHVDSILRVTDFSKMKLAEDGKLDGAEDLKKTISSDWSGFITSTGEKPSETPETPPDNNGAESKKTGRAAELAAKYHDNLYGKAKED